MAAFRMEELIMVAINFSITWVIKRITDIHFIIQSAQSKLNSIVLINCMYF